MTLARLTVDAFGVVTIALVTLFIVLGLLCICYSIYFHLCIRKQGLLQLGYFNGPWVTRVALVLVAAWWGIWEIVRLNLLKGNGRVFTSLAWQKNVCKYYILSNIGFAEPNLLLILVFLLRASLQKWGSGALSRRWNKKTVFYAFTICLPMFILQLGFIFFAPKLLAKTSHHDAKLADYLWRTSCLTHRGSICTYPLFSTALLGLYNMVLIIYVSYFGAQMVSSAINKWLRRRVRVLIISVTTLLPARVALLGVTVLLKPGSLAFEAVVFLAFLVLILCALVGVCVLVYYPVADSLALRDLVHSNIGELPFDDYYCDGAYLVAGRSLLPGRRIALQNEIQHHLML